MNVQRNILACAPPCQCGRFFLYAFIFVAWLCVTWILYSSESCIHACTLYPRTCLKTSRKTSGVYPWPWDSGVLHTWFPWWGTTVCSMQPCLWILSLYLTLRITDALPCVGYTVASPCFGLHFFSVYCTWTALSLFPCFSCLCANAHMYVEAKEDFGCPPLLLSALFPWDRISHWNGRSPFFQLRMAISNPHWSSCLHPPSEWLQAPHPQPHPVFLVGSGNLNSGFHACTTNTFTQGTPGPILNLISPSVLVTFFCFCDKMLWPRQLRKV